MCKDLQIQLEQTLTKEEPAFSSSSDQRPSRTGKSRSRTSKQRRSPYPHITHTTDYPSPPAPEYPERPTYSDTSATVMAADMAAAQVQAQMQAGYSGMLYSGNENMDSRYAQFYASTYAHPGIYGSDSNMGMYPYAAHRYFDERNAGYRSGYEDNKYYPYSGYMMAEQGQTPPLNSPRLAHSPPSRESCRQSGDTSQGVAGTYDSSCIHGGGSRSSSREACCTNTYTAQSSYPISYSTRSESSTSEAEMSTPLEDKRKSTGTTASCVSRPAERTITTQQTSIDTIARSGGDGKNYKAQKTVAPQSGATKELTHQSVIMRSGSSSSSNNNNSTSTNNNRHANVTNCSLAEIGCQARDLNSCQPHELSSCQQSQELSSCQSRDLSSCQSRDAKTVVTVTGGVATCNEGNAIGNGVGTCLTNGSPSDTRTGMALPNQTNSVYGANPCNYDLYKQTAYQASNLQTQRPAYPMMAQAGYTSVIVDAQQYQMANGYAHVHWHTRT